MKETSMEGLKMDVYRVLDPGKTNLNSLYCNIISANL